MRARLTAGVLLSAALWVAIGCGAYAFVSTRHAIAPKSTALRSRSGASSFSHLYPPDPAPYERPSVGTKSPRVAPAGRLATGKAESTMAALAAALHPGVVRHESATTWLVRQPMELNSGTSLSLTGPLTIELAPSAFILAEHGATLSLTDVTVVSVIGGSTPQSSPVRDRGFIDVRDGATVLLHHDVFRDLGHLGDQTYGVTLDRASSRSEVVDCTVLHDYFGIYLGRLSGGTVSGNTFVDSVVYGIDPHTLDSNLLITRNTVTGSGVHGIVLADHASHNIVSHNTITSTRDHGIVVYQFSNDNLIEDNVVSGTFDGIVLSDSSGNHVVGNKVGPVTRFGLRMSGISSSNTVAHNSFGKAIVGMYLYQGARDNVLVGNVFRQDYENVRIRSDAPRNRVTPNPGKSEL